MLLPNLINQKTGILPFVELQRQNDKEYLIITVRQSSVPISYHGHYYMRSGSMTTALQGNQLSDFLLRKSGITWDVLDSHDAHRFEHDSQAIEHFKRLSIDRLPNAVNENSSR